MVEFFNVFAPLEAQSRWLEALALNPRAETVSTSEALNRVTAATLRSAEALPAFRRSTVDGYAVRAADTHGAGEALPAYLHVAGEVLMGQMAGFDIRPRSAALVHTGGALPESADAVVMVENTQTAGPGEIEVVRAAAAGENVLQVGEDIQPGDAILPAGHRLRPQDIGGLMALGITQVKVARRPVVAIISSGDEVVPPSAPIAPGQVRDINSYTLAAQTRRAGGVPLQFGIVADDADALRDCTADALARADFVVLSAGSSVSVRDLTATTINAFGSPGVLVHGVAVKPGKPTILGVVQNKPIMGLPGNPVSAMVVYRLFGVPMIWHLLGASEPPQRRIPARLGANIAGAAGREDYVAVRLHFSDSDLPTAEPIFGKSNLIYTLVHAAGLVRVPLDSTGLREGERVDVQLF